MFAASQIELCVATMFVCCCQHLPPGATHSCPTGNNAHFTPIQLRDKASKGFMPNIANPFPLAGFTSGHRALSHPLETLNEISGKAYALCVARE